MKVWIYAITLLSLMVGTVISAVSHGVDARALYNTFLSAIVAGAGGALGVVWTGTLIWKLAAYEDTLVEIALRFLPPRPDRSRRARINSEES